MKALLAAVFLVLSVPAFSGVPPQKLALRNGRTFEGVTSAEMDGDKLRVVHAGGVSRIAAGDLTPESQKSIGLEPTDEAKAGIQKLARVETTDGKIYEGVSGVKVTPSGISFVYSGGATSVKFERLPDDVKKACGYDREKSEAYERKKAEEETALAIAQANADAKAILAAQRKRSAEKERQIQMMLQYTEKDPWDYWSMSRRERQFYDAVRARAIRDIRSE